jgi:mRNA-degrading endonuclease toxin of MazEF toxin-antitoxin module
MLMLLETSGNFALRQKQNGLRPGRMRTVVAPNPGWAELWIVDAGGSNRPALVLTRPEAVDRLDRVLVALGTTTIRHLPSEDKLGPDEGISCNCVLNFDSPELLSRFRFLSFVGDFPIDRWPEVCAALASAINC